MSAHNFIDLTGLEFGQLRVVGRADERGSHGEAKWLCLCACGATAVVLGQKLRTGYTKSCGCLKRRRGADNPATDKRPLLDRLAEHSHRNLTTGCLIWNGHRQPFGHGIISVLGEMKSVHRIAWTEQRGPIPKGLDCLHDCPGGDNPACWNVDHLWLGTQTDNNIDRDRKGVHLLLTPRGEDHGCAKLTIEQVIAIRSDARTSAVLAEQYGVSFGQICKIKSRRAWGHVP